VDNKLSSLLICQVHPLLWSSYCTVSSFVNPLWIKVSFVLLFSNLSRFQLTMVSLRYSGSVIKFQEYDISLIGIKLTMLPTSSWSLSFYVFSFRNLNDTLPPSFGSIITTSGNHWVNCSGSMSAENTLSIVHLLLFLF
jgi:hypothetical protein